jgi:mono/diheme cytochrome c family protein
VLALLSLALPPALGPLTACNQPPSADSLREWTPADHHSADDDKLAAARQAAPAGSGPSSKDDVTQLVDLAWRQQCAQCHGPMGKGDGPMGPMLHASDLTDPAWQGKTSDAEVAAIIKNGKDRMPGFDLPDPVVQGLVARVRQLRGR